MLEVRYFILLKFRHDGHLLIRRHRLRTEPRGHETIYGNGS